MLVSVRIENDCYRKDHITTKVQWAVWMMILEICLFRIVCVG